MGSILTKGFGRATAIPRKLGTLPEETETPRGTLDILAGAKKPTGGGTLGSAIGRFGRFGRQIKG